VTRPVTHPSAFVTLYPRLHYPIPSLLDPTPDTITTYPRTRPHTPRDAMHFIIAINQLHLALGPSSPASDEGISFFDSPGSSKFACTNCVQYPLGSLMSLDFYVVCEDLHQCSIKFQETLHSSEPFFCSPAAVPHILQGLGACAHSICLSWHSLRTRTERGRIITLSGSTWS
jgi:hypothetical protein